MNSPEVDRAAAEFASLIGSDQNQNEANTKLSDNASDAAAFEADQQAPEERVGERQQGGDQKKDGDGQKGDGEKGEQGSEGGGDEQAVVFGDAILKGLSRGAEAAPVQSAQGTRDTTLDGIVQQVAEKIMVSDPSSGQREVRIILKNSILPGTEVRITQNAGRVQIHLVTESQRSHELLAQNQATLQQRLAEKLEKHDVVVEIELDGQGQPDPEGRSRQRNEITDDDEES